jgi:hypothetical protein
MRVEIDVDAWEIMREVGDEDLEAEVERRRKDKRPQGKPDAIDQLIGSIDHDLMETALWAWERRRVEDALYYLEQALGRKFVGLSDVLLRRAS